MSLEVDLLLSQVTNKSPVWLTPELNFAKAEYSDPNNWDLSTKEAMRPN